MARFGVSAIMASALLGLLMLVQLVAARSIPDFNRAEDDVFLLGAGKADITGYISDKLP